jgi:hypothetical protein
VKIAGTFPGRIKYYILHDFLLQKMINDTTIAIVAIVAVIGLLGLVFVETMSIQQQQQQQAFARGCKTSQAFNASQGRCFGH